MKFSSRGWNVSAKLGLWTAFSSSCWLWEGGKDDCGYGVLTVGGRTDKTHRWAWREANGREVPNDLVVMHSCDTPACINPAHLSANTQSANMRDAYRKGRVTIPDHRGEKSPCAILTDAAVLAIRADTRRQHEIAAQYGISRPHVSFIKSRRFWRHI